MLATIANKLKLPEPLRKRLIFLYIASGWPKLRQWLLYGDLHYVDAIGVEIGTGCNRRCGYCPVSVSPEKFASMPMDLYRLIISRIAETRFRGPVSLTGYNEPLLMKNLEEYVAIARKAMPRTSLDIFSNGDFLTPERAWSLAKAGITQIRVSRHIGNDDKWEQKVLKARDACPAHVRLAWVAETGWTNRGGIVDIPVPIPPHTGDTYTPCFRPQSPYVDINGEVLFCCNDYYRKHSMGSLKTQSFNAIYYSPRYRKLRDDIRNGIRDLHICKVCVSHDDHL